MDKGVQIPSDIMEALQNALAPEKGRGKKKWSHIYTFARTETSHATSS